MLRRINIIAGPTAVGKTALALRWAQEHNAEIVNADALLFYRGMDIGTAKPSAAERATVPHHLIDIAAPTEALSIRRYVSAAEQIVREIAEERGRPVLVVGGSGFYLRSFFLPVVDEVPPSPEVRAEVDALEAQGAAALLHALRQASPEGTGGVDLLNPRRVARALERCLTTGRSVPQLEADFAALPRPFPDYEKRLCLLRAPDAILHPRIAMRTRAMLEQGLPDEVQQLRREGIESNPAAASAIGYRETIAWLREQETQTPPQSDPPPATAAPEPSATTPTSSATATPTLPYATVPASSAITPSDSNNAAPLHASGVPHPSAVSPLAKATAAPPSRSGRSRRSAIPPPAGSIADLEATINLNTRRLVAKQRKWFRNQTSPDLILDRTATAHDDTLYAALCACFG